jgi:hypothetical protein
LNPFYTLFLMVTIHITYETRNSQFALSKQPNKHNFQRLTHYTFAY